MRMRDFFRRTATKTIQAQQPEAAVPVAVEGAKAAQDAGPGWDIVFGTEGRRDWQNANALWDTLTAGQMEVIYRNSALVYGCAREIATTLAEAPLQVGFENPDGEWQVVPHPLDAIFDMPTPDYDYNEWLQRFASRLLLTGRGFIWKFRQNSGMIGELWPMPTSSVKPIDGTAEENGMVISRLQKGYEINQGFNKEPQIVGARDMVDARFADPASTNQGVGPMQAAARDYQLDRGREDYLIEMLTNLKVPGMLIRSTQPLNTADKDAIRNELHNRAGHGARGGPIFISGKDSEAKMIAPLADMDWPGFASMEESRICMAFGVPPILVGARVGLDRSTYANYAEARKSFYTETMVPLWAAIQGVFTRSLLRHEGEERLDIRFDLSDVAGLQQDADKIAMRAQTLFGGGIITLNQALAMVGEPAIGPAGDVRRVPIMVQEVPIGEAANAPADTE